MMATFLTERPWPYMRRSLLSLAVLLLGMPGVHAQDTLRNLLVETPRTIDVYSPGWGYYSGHNHRYTEEYAEKYRIQGEGSLIGVISEHTGVVANPNNISQFRAYAVGSNGLPSTLLANANVRYGRIDLSGTPMLTTFLVPAQVTDSFFVSFNLTDYAHGGFEWDTIGLLYGEHGSRPEEDLALFGRNVVRHHSHGAPAWRDFYFGNFTPVATHFALFPILSFPVGIGPISTHEFRVDVFPNPFVEEVMIRLTDNTSKELTVHFYNDMGQVVKERSIQGADLDMEGSIRIDCQELAAGKYIVLIKGHSGGIATQLVKG